MTIKDRWPSEAISSCLGSDKNWETSNKGMSAQAARLTPSDSGKTIQVMLMLHTKQTNPHGFGQSNDSFDWLDGFFNHCCLHSAYWFFLYIWFIIYQANEMLQENEVYTLL